MFCSCTADYQNNQPNSLVCPVCLGMPGALPVINKKAVEYTLMTGLALNCTIPNYAKFDRKNYPYPDLMKGYQISQFDMPLALNGHLTIDLKDTKRVIGITRVHLEEDVAKLIHKKDFNGSRYTLVDVNRSGVSLMEIVSEPDMRTPEEARNYLIKLKTILEYLGVSTCNMEEGNLRCDANISLRPTGTTKLLDKVEVKNMNSFRSVFKALEYEIKRQEKILQSGGRIEQETRGWVDDEELTFSQRSKESAHDYRFFPEPDLPPLSIDKKWIESIDHKLPELPDIKRDRFALEYGLSLYDATILTASRNTADFFEQATLASDLKGKAIQKRAKSVSNWTIGEIAHLLNLNNLDINNINITPLYLNALLNLIDNGTLNTSSAKLVFELMFETGDSPDKIIKERDMRQITDPNSIGPIVEEVIANNANAVVDYLNGKEQALKFLVGQVMRLSKGKANPSLAEDSLKMKLATIRNS
jgi:aspartyl-tRNA(Asn)/glutamyl-tRNA(Gln) amidotransferase subunit B